MEHRHRWLIGALVVVALVGLALIAPGEEGAIAEGGIIYVDADAAGANDGTSWADAYADLQEALEAAGTGYQIWVAEGTYKPTQLFIEDDPRSAAFQMVNGVEIYGGFSGYESDLEKRDWETNVTVLSGDIGTEGVSSDNSYHVFYHPSGTGLDTSAVLDGFSITGGNADLYEYPHFFGGGMFNYASAPTLVNCTFTGNSSAYAGGGMANGWYPSPTLTNCIFEGNLAQYGGAVYNGTSATPMLKNCTLQNNSADEGGGMFNEQASPTVTGCVFQGNTAGSGGGMYNWYGSSPVVTKCTFKANNGGGMTNSMCSPTVTDCTFVANTGSGMRNSEASPVVTNCTFWGNSAGSYSGGGMQNSYSSPTLTNCTFYGNLAEYGGAGGIYNYNSSSPMVTNSVLWGDTYPEIQSSGDSTPIVTYSNIQGYYGGVGNISMEPRFVDQANGNFHLGICSPCIDAGNNEAPGLPVYDFEGDDRIVDGDGDEIAIVDMGVDEARKIPPVVVYVDPEAGGANNGTSWGDAYTDLQAAFTEAEEGMEIWVAEGTYRPTSGTDRNASFQMKNCVAIYGGFAGDESSLGERDWVANPTILSGDIGTERDDTDNSYHVFYHPSGTNLKRTAVLNGFVITGGNADGESSNSVGGGMFNDGSSPTVSNCIFMGNSAESGGGMYNAYSSPTLTNCTFSSNSAIYYGGGMVNTGSPTLINCIFTGNSASSGGGISNGWGAAPVLTNCTFWGNTAGSGGAIDSSYASVWLTNSILWGNSPDQLSQDESWLVVTYSDIEGGYEGEGNIDADPQFVNPDSSDLHLGPGSPCIDVADNDAEDLPLYDFEGDARVLDGNDDQIAIVDMGVDEVVYAGPPVVEVEIDVRPGSDQNPINLGSGGVVPVAILTNEEFDASTVRPASVQFAGAAPRRWTREDVDRDGDEDLLLNFRIQDLDLDESSTEATLIGETFPWAGGVAIEGTDIVRIIP